MVHEKGQVLLEEKLHSKADPTTGRFVGADLRDALQELDPNCPRIRLLQVRPCMPCPAPLAVLLIRAARYAGAEQGAGVQRGRRANVLYQAAGLRVRHTGAVDGVATLGAML